MHYNDFKSLHKKEGKFILSVPPAHISIWMCNTIHAENKAMISEMPFDYFIFTIFRKTPATTVFQVVD